MKKLIILLISTFLLLTTISCNDDEDFKYNNDSKVLQSHEILGNVKRKAPNVSNEGLERYPSYNSSFDGSVEEKEAIANENKLLNASNTTYDQMDEFGNLYLNNQSINRKLYKHSASEGLYGGNVSDTEKAVIKKINITPRPLGNYITGLYAPAGEVIKIEISEEDLTETGGFSIWIGNAGNRSSGAAEIPLEKTFTRMPYTVNEMKVDSTTTYVGSFLGGAIYLGEPKNKNASYSVTISGAVEYTHFILGLTTIDEYERIKDSSAPYFDLEIWDDGIRHSGPKYTLEKIDYDSIYRIACLWEKISLISNQAPSASANVGISMRYDTYIPAGAAVAFVGANFCVLPVSWFNGSLDYEGFTSNGMWGTIHELNHHYQGYGAKEGGEVTNNAMSLLSYALYTKISSSRNDEANLSGWNAYTYASYPLELLINNKSEDPIYSLEAYATLIHSFGVDTFLKAIELQKANNDNDSWYKAWCLASGYDMTYYFEELLNYNLDSKVKDFVSSLGYEMFIPISSIYQTKASYNDMRETVRPYEVDYDSLIDIDLRKSLIIPSDLDYEIIDIKNESKGELVKNNNGFTYKIKEDDFLSNKIDVTIKLKNSNYDLKPITLTFEFIQKEKKVEVTTYKYNDDSIYKNIAVAEANSFLGYSETKSSYSGSFNVNSLSKNTITVTEGKVYIDNIGKYRFYIKGQDNVFMYISLNNNKNYKLCAYLNSNSNYTNEVEEAYYDIEIKKPTYIYIKTVTLSKSDNGYSNVGYGRFIGDDVKASALTDEYILNNNDKFQEKHFETENYYPKNYYTGNNLINTNDFKIVDSTNFTPWDDNYNLENMLDGNINTYAHNDSLLTDEISITIDMTEENMFNFIEIFGKNSSESHTPTTFDLYFGNTLEELKLYKSYQGLKLNNRSVFLEFEENITTRYIKLVIKETESNRYVAISKLDIGIQIPDSKIISIMDSKVIKDGNFNTINNEHSNFASMISSKKGYIKYEFEGNLIGIYGLALNGGKIKIKIDDKKYETITIKEKEDLVMIYLNNNLEFGKHTIEIKVNDENIQFCSIFYS